MRTEIYINKTLIDITDEIDMSLNFAIADIKNPDKRNSSYSKTITIPASKTNNILFTYIYDISKEAQVAGIGTLNFAPDFNPNLKATCQIYVDSLLQLNGYAQLLEIKITGDRMEYEIAVFGQLSNLMTSVDGIDLNQLDYSEFNHVFNKTNQKNSWDTSIIKNGSDYFNFSSGVPTGEGYVYPLINYGKENSQIQFDVTSLNPAIYLKTYIDKIFAYGGFTYTSDFFESEFFRRLIIPFSGEIVKLSPFEVDSRKFSANTVISRFVVNTDTWNMLYTNDSTGGAFDNASIYNPSTGIYTVNKKGTYDISAVTEVTIVITPPPGTISVTGQGRIAMFVEKIGFGAVASDSILFDPTASGGTFTFTTKANSIELEIGDQIHIYAFFDNAFLFHNALGGSTNLAGFTFTFGSNTKLFNTPIMNPLVDGDTFILSSSVPKVPIKDFFMSIVKMFNLYVSPDALNENNLLIEPQKDFYADGTVVDWTDKLDTSKLIEIKPVSEIQGKTYKYSYKEDKDFYNQDYQDKFTEVYGERDININNDFVKGVVSLGLIFSPTISSDNFTNDMIIPYILKKSDTDGSYTPTSGNPRILYYGGVKATSEPWQYTSTAAGLSNESTYPYAGNLDDPYNPTLDLLFGVPQQTYYHLPQGNYTTNNIYNIYHKQFVEEITDKDSKIVIAYFRLTPLDIFQLNFKNHIHVNGINYRLNRIYDYNPLKNLTTRIELAKIKRGLPFVGGTTNIDTNNPASGFGLIEGGEDEVRSLSAVSVIHLIEGGVDEVTGLGSFNNINLVNGGKN